ncbi:MAG: NAD(P)-binding protein [Elusimicrobia bacterium]|nr:NAD(P)-binding protein [Elusimicrobiota bacterium]
METIKTDILIAGAGISGLSAAHHLEKRGRKNYLLVEKAADYGGLCGSVQKDGYTFDWSGHLLHLHTNDGMKLVKNLLGGNINRLERSAWIYSHQACTGYPFQASLYGLPKDIITECVTGAVRARENNSPPKPGACFRDWALSLFGDGICRHFMFPYNEKLWGVPPQELGSDWCAPFVPRPSLDEIIRGAYWPGDKKFGYNPSFLYPLKGGCRALCAALAENVKNLKLGCELEKVDLHAKTAVVKNLGKVKYKKLIATVPLKTLAGLAALPAELRRHADALKAQKVRVLNLGFPCKTADKHWIYFPEADFPFYRAGIASNFSPNAAPAGHSSFYIEIPAQNCAGNEAAIEKSVLKGLERCGLLPKNPPKPDSVLRLDIETAYAVYNSDRAPAVQALTAYLGKHGCHCTGRYGLWRYSFMEQDLLDARDLALKLSR